MKPCKKILTMALACALTLSLAVPAMACAPTHGFDYTGGETVGSTANSSDAAITEGTESTYTTGNGHTTPFVGIIKPTQIKATIPTKVVFDLDPSIEAYQNDVAKLPGGTGNPFTAQVTQPNIKIVNNSDVPIYVYVDTVQATGATLTKTLTDVTNNSNSKYVMFGLKAVVPTFNASTLNLTTTPATYWMTGAQSTDKVTDENGKHYYITAGLGDANTALAANDNNGGGADETAVQILAVTKNGWTADETFTVMPVFVVSVRNRDKTGVDIKAQTVTAPPSPSPSTP